MSPLQDMIGWRLRLGRKIVPRLNLTGCRISARVFFRG
jgi:hypothetical protein